MTPRNSHFRDACFDKRRTILGHRVLVRVPVTDMDGLVQSTFSVRIKDTDRGDRDFTCPAFFYWQAFNEARKYLLSAQR